MLYKFFRLNENSVSAISQYCLYAALPIRFNDPFEGWCQIEGVSNSMLSNQIGLPDLVHRYRERRGVICFSGSRNQENPIYNTLMWSHYADSHKGFCIEFRDEIKDILKKSNYYIFHNWVQYSTPPKMPLSATGDELEPILTKDICWEEEREFRFIFKSKGLVSFGSKEDNNINAIYLGTEFQSNNNQTLKDELLQFILDNKIKCYQQIKSHNTYILQSQEILDFPSNKNN